MAKIISNAGMQRTSAFGGFRKLMVSDMDEPERILIVDDEDRNIISMTTLLTRPGRELFTAKSGTEALKLLQRQSVDLILLDVQMPGPSGFDTAELIRKRPSLYEIPIIFVTAIATSDEFISKGFAVGAYDYIVKPVQADLLENKVEIFLDLYRSKRQARAYASTLHSVISYSPIAYATINKDGIVVLVNPAFETIFGVAKDEMIGLTEDLFEQSLARLGMYRLPERGAENDTEVEEVRYLEITKPSYYMLARYDRPILDDSGRRAGKVVTFRDVTRENELQRMKSDFISIAAHELRTPLATLMGYSELLVAREYSEEQRAELLGVIHRQAKLMTGMVSELMDLSLLESRRASEINWEQEPIIEIIGAAIESVSEPALTQRVNVEKDLPNFNLVCDRVKVVGAIRNVLTNALKYSPADRDVVLRVLSRVEDSEEMYGVNVVDRGIGMTREELDQIFERFYRADKSGSVPGTGLGMSLVKEIVNIHGGEVEIESKKGAGTSVTLWFPKVPRAATMV